MHMSSTEQEKSKRIEIKPYEYIKRQIQEKKPSISLDEQKEGLERSISQMQDELSTLKQQKETLLKEVQTAIKNERASWDTEKKQLTEQAQQAGYEAGLRNKRNRPVMKLDLLRVKNKTWHKMQQL